MTENRISTMRWLRDATSEEHYRAEHHTFQQAMLNGELSRTDYIAWLGQMYLVHEGLEKALRQSAESHDVIRQVVREHQYQVPYLLQDLQFFGVAAGEIEPLPATERFLARLAEGKDDPLLLLGLHYVLEGSNNGSRFIARRIAKAHKLAAGPGLRYLDPYGDAQRDHWMDFKSAVESLSFTREETDRMVAAAKQMYQSVAELADDLDSSR